MAMKNSPNEKDREEFKNGNYMLCAVAYFFPFVVDIYTCTARQHAKAFNFGIAGGEGVQAIRDHALSAYGVDISPEEARSFKNKLIYEVYPEFSTYLYENLVLNLARNLKKTVILHCVRIWCCFIVCVCVL